MAILVDEPLIHNVNVPTLSMYFCRTWTVPEFKIRNRIYCQQLSDAAKAASTDPIFVFASLTASWRASIYKLSGKSEAPESLPINTATSATSADTLLKASHIGEL